MTPSRSKYPIDGWISEVLVRKTLEVWQKRADSPLTEADAIEILRNTKRCLTILEGDAA